MADWPVPRFEWIDETRLPERIGQICTMYWNCDHDRVLVIFEDGTKVGAPLTSIRERPEFTKARRSARVKVRLAKYRRKNSRRGDLIDKKIYGSLTPEETAELAELETYVSDIIDAACPRDPFPDLEDALRLIRGEYDVQVILKPENPLPQS